MDIALSTSWNAFRFENGKDIVREIKTLGFTELELSFNLTQSIVNDVSVLESKGLIKIISVHNFCPIPDGVERKLALPDYYSLASLDAKERNLAINFTKRTIDTAKMLNAKAVVLHAGRIEIQDKTKALMRFFNNSHRNSKEFEALKSLIIKERERQVKPYFESALKSLDEISEYAGMKGINLGIENRYYFREIPSLEEIEIILDKFSNRNIFYWHDVGHAQIWQNMGFYSNLSYLEKYSNKMLGIHLHDVIGTDDHQPPLKGNIDFTKIAPFINKDTIKVMEAHHPATGQDIKKGAQYLDDIFNRRKVKVD
ncbi:MAG: sugar phosphate isomerase/epimerase family protein [Candidatus Omnitrophota bacterium]|nr:sugar phosphate isomerase/epimerase family protein [Candidatus Omnitrophota bacterium]